MPPSLLLAISYLYLASRHAFAAPQVVGLKDALMPIASVTRASFYILLLSLWIRARRVTDSSACSSYHVEFQPSAPTNNYHILARDGR